MFNISINLEFTVRKEKIFELPELAFNTFEAKKYALVLRLNVYIHVKPTNFISTQLLYDLYEQNIKNTNFFAQIKQ